MSDNKPNRRLKMEVLQGIPPEILVDALDFDSPSEVPNIVKMTRKEADEEIMDLYQEKKYLIASIEYLKERLSKAQTTK